MGKRKRSGLRAKVKRQGGQCHYCPTHLNFRVPSFKNPDGATRDHVIPRSKVTSALLRYNVVACCWWCNHMKGDMSEAEFRSKLPLLLEKHGRKFSHAPV